MSENPKRIVTGECRLSYLNVFTPRADDSGDPKYSACLLIPKTDTKTIDAIKGVVELIKSEVGVKAKGRGFKEPLKDGDEQAEEHPEFKGHYILNVRSKQQPQMVDAHCQPIIDSESLYSGCYGRASISGYYFEREHNRGVSFGLNSLQKTADGAPLFGFVNAADEFDDGFKSSHCDASEDAEIANML